MTYVIDPAKPGTMSAVSKLAFAARPKAEAAAAGSAEAQLVDFDAALTLAYLEMAKDTAMIRKRRGEKRHQMGMKMPGSH